MHGLMSGAIARVATFARSLRLRQALIVTLIGLLALTSTACSGATDARSADNVGVKQGYYGSSPYDKNDGPTRELYKPVQKREGGMNNYNDDPKYDRADVKANVQERVRQAAENLNKNQAHNPKEVFSNIKNRNPLDDKAEQTSDSITKSAEKLANDFSEGTRKGVRNVQENLDRAGDAAPRVLNESKRNAQGALDDVREGTEAVLQGGKNVVGRAGELLQDRASDAVDAVGDRL
ncbi:MAG: hypothetical protein NW220_22175 [Leptolyngbyaceae cyanobacterium bins.349]|nr:hypothetical protein [Leptolyngbyaceae cyanobacterium bins.349]